MNRRQVPGRGSLARAKTAAALVCANALLVIPCGAAISDSGEAQNPPEDVICAPMPEAEESFMSESAQETAVYEVPDGFSDTGEEIPLDGFEDRFMYEKESDGVRITGFVPDGSRNVVEIPAFIGGLPVRAIGRTDELGPAFAWCTIGQIPSTVREIGSHAFLECTFADGLDLTGVERFGQWCFVRTQNDPTVVLPEGLREVPAGMFCDSVNLTQISGGDIESVGAFAFCGCIALSEIPLHSVRFVAGCAFEGCASLGTPDMPLLEAAADTAFRGCAERKEA